MPSQPQSPKVLTQDWANLQPFSLINALDSVSTLSITFSGEVQSNNGRLFLRALVDGVAASPADVTLIQGGSKWRAASHTFIVKNLRAGVHRISIQAKADPATRAQVRRSSIRTLWKRRSGSDFVQPFLGMAPLVRTYRLLVVGFDPIRSGHPRPPFALIKATFEGAGEPPVIGRPTNRISSNIFDEGPNVRDWLAENSGGVARLGAVRYVGCLDDAWYVAPPERQGSWYWDNGAFAQMWKDALAAADPDVNFHSYDTDHNNKLETDDLIVAIVRPQADPYGTLRGTTTTLDGQPAPLTIPILDLYLSSNPAVMLTGVGVTCHELCHLIGGAADLYGSCSAIDPGYYSVMDQHFWATHLDPFHKMKNGMIQPFAMNLTLQGTTTITLPSVERHRQILLLHDTDRVAREYFLVENRFPGTLNFKNYDGPLGAGAIVVWQIFEDLNLVLGSAICSGDPRFIRRRATLMTPTDSFDLAWSDGTAAGFRLSSSTPNAEQAMIHLKRL
jgi:M6 family metalloprotease-like protein